MSAVLSRQTFPASADRCKYTKVLDLFCGRGGWSKPFLEDGDDVWGIDIKNLGYPGKLIQSDIRELDGIGFSDMDLVIGSPPCVDFSTAGQSNKGRKDRKPESMPDPARGLKLIGEFNRFIQEAQPRFWAMENVARAGKFYAPKPQWRFKVSVLGWRSLWGNLPLGLGPEFKFKRFLNRHRRKYEYSGLNWDVASALRAEIPYPIARFVADSVKGITRI